MTNTEDVLPKLRTNMTVANICLFFAFGQSTHPNFGYAETKQNVSTLKWGALVADHPRAEN